MKKIHPDTLLAASVLIWTIVFPLVFVFDLIPKELKMSSQPTIPIFFSIVVVITWFGHYYHLKIYHKK